MDIKRHPVQSNEGVLLLDIHIYLGRVLGSARMLCCVFSELCFVHASERKS